MSDKSLIYPFFLPNMGCPKGCIFCDQTKISGQGSFDIGKALREGEAFIRRNPDKRKEIAFYGGSFTALSKGFQEQILEAFLSLSSDFALRISTHPLFIDDEILSFLKEHRVETIELGIQDFSDEILKQSGRNYTKEKAIQACRLIQEKGITLGIQLMPGLPGYSQTSDRENFKQIEEIKPKYLRLYPTIVIKGTPLAHLYTEGRYQPLSTKEAVSICTEYHFFCQKTDTRIIKYGIPSNLSKDEVLAGPYHPAFGELVKQEILIRQIENGQVDKNNLTPKEINLLNAHGCKYLFDGRTESYRTQKH